MNVRNVLSRWDLQPDKRLGQNFLADPRILQRIVAAANIGRRDMVLEIGAGLGNLTEQLACSAGHVVAVELDRRLLPALEDNLRSYENVTVVQGDILELDPAALMRIGFRQNTGCDQFKTVANLPYYITSAVLRHLLEADRSPARIVVTVQLEVARRIVAQPGDMSMLAISVQFYGHPRILFHIKPGSFYPQPTVKSAVVQIDRHLAPPVLIADPDRLFRVARAGFSQRRKQLRNSLAAGLSLPVPQVTAILTQASVDPRRRAQTLTLAEWADIARLIPNTESDDASTAVREVC